MRAVDDLPGFLVIEDLDELRAAKAVLVRQRSHHRRRLPVRVVGGVENAVGPHVLVEEPGDLLAIEVGPGAHHRELEDANDQRRDRIAPFALDLDIHNQALVAEPVEAAPELRLVDAGQRGKPPEGCQTVRHPRHEVGLFGGVELPQDLGEGLVPGGARGQTVDLLADQMSHPDPLLRSQSYFIPFPIPIPIPVGRTDNERVQFQISNLPPTRPQ